jgi:hypothetical protein
VYSVRAEPVEALLDKEPFDELRVNGILGSESVVISH